MVKKISCLVLFSSFVCLNVAWADSAPATQPAASKTSATVPPTITVQATKVVTANIPKVASSLGSLVATQKVTISSEVDGRIAKILFKNGQEVAKGMPIAQLDDTQAAADYQKAVTQMQLSRKSYQRGQQAGDAISKQKLQELKATMLSDQADLQSKQATLNEEEITAPFSGVLGAFKVNQGDFITKGSPIVTLVNIDDLQVNYPLGEDLFPELKKNQLCTITSNAYPGKVFYATVNYISPTINEDTRTVAVQALISSTEDQLRPGMFVQVEQQLALQKSALVVPSQSVLADVKGYYVYKIIANKASKITVTIGTRTKGQVQILTGLKAGESVVTAGQEKLSDGSVITVSANTPATTSSSQSGGQANN